MINVTKVKNDVNIRKTNDLIRVDELLFCECKLTLFDISGNK